VQLQHHGEPEPGPDETVAEVLERSQEVINRFEGARQDRKKLDGLISTLRETLPAAETRVQRADEELVRWQQKWAVAVARIGLDADASAAQANAVLAAIGALFQKLHEADGFRRRIEGMDRDTAQFTAGVKEVVMRVSTDLAGLDAEAAAQQLHLRLKRARTARQSRDSLLGQKKLEAEKLREAQVALRDARRRLEIMCREAHCENHEQLPLAEQRSLCRQQLENEIRQHEEHLLTLSAGMTLNEFIADAVQVEADGLDLKIVGLEKDTKKLEGESSQLDQTIGSERTLLASMEGNTAAGEAAEIANQLRAKLRTDVEQYVQLRLAAVVLSKAIDRYRKKNQGAILERASELFSKLTVGSFESLQVDYDEENKPILIGVRAGDRETVGVGGMSEGSCDQLYLALRLASLEAYLERHEPLPFIVDDILLHFDNDRAAAALTALAELSRLTQVVFFTHHHHLVEMATACVPGDVLFVHRLAEATAGIA
jgi:uncharacterized protein YhaN